MKLPAMAATWLRPRAMPRWLAGNASVRIALELANSIAPPMPCRIRMMIRYQPAASPCSQLTDSRMENSEKIAKPMLNMRTRPNMSPRRPKLHDEDGRDDHEAHHHPQQDGGVARLQRVDADAAEDVRQRDQHDRRVDGDHQHAERGVGQGDPLVARADGRSGLRRSLPAGLCWTRGADDGAGNAVPP